jgi:hypothetical protein
MLTKDKEKLTSLSEKKKKKNPFGIYRPIQKSSTIEVTFLYGRYTMDKTTTKKPQLGQNTPNGKGDIVG